MVGERGGMAMGLGRVQARGQVTIPAEVRGALRIRPGDVLLFEATGPDEGRFRVVRTTRSLDEYFDRWRVDGPVPADLWETVAEDVARDALPFAVLDRSEREAAAAGER